jgi:hypothetical protein
VRVVVWNIAKNPRAFDALRTLKADIALLNEAKPPESATGISRLATAGRDGATRPWATANLSAHPLTEITDAVPSWRGRERRVPFVCSRPGSWIAGSVDIPGADQVTAVALYGLMDELSDASLHRSLSELSPVLDDPAYQQHVLLGGDLNTGTAWPATEPFLARDRNLLERFEALGLVDCLARMRTPGRLPRCRCTFGDDCTHTRTRRDRRWPQIPYQTDYLWASRPLAQHLVSCTALAMTNGSRSRITHRSWPSST